MKSNYPILFLSFIIFFIVISCSKQLYEPSLKADITLVGEEFHLTWTSDMNITPNNIGKRNVEREGYAKVFIDGIETFELKNKNGISLNLDTGNHNVVIELFKNDGTSYGIKKVFENVSKY